MDITLRKGNTPIVRSLTAEQHVQLTTIDLAYSELSDNKIIAMLLGHGINNLEIEFQETENHEAIIALIKSANNVTYVGEDCSESTFKILSDIYPDKLGTLRRAKMLNRNMLGVVINE